MFAVESSFNDYKYILNVWDNLRSYDDFSREEGKYSKEFSAWSSLYKKDKNAALRKLDGLSKEDPLKRGYDLQLAYDQWRDNVYFPWFRDRKSGMTKVTFDEYLSNSAKKREGIDCQKRYDQGQRNFPDACGLLPDWRDEDDKMKEKAMMAEADKRVSKLK
ncbi:hypothetical protein GCM10027396_00030 [Insolitispirillum peregrinum]